VSFSAAGLRERGEGGEGWEVSGKALAIMRAKHC